MGQFALSRADQATVRDTRLAALAGGACEGDNVFALSPTGTRTRRSVAGLSGVTCTAVSARELWPPVIGVRIS